MSDIEKLFEPFPPEKVSWRAGKMTKDKTKTMALAYIDARDVMQRLDDVIGPLNWQAEYSHTHPAICRIGIRFNDEWIWKSNGAGDTKVEADKGGLSDAFKRAAVLWGIGRYLYDIKSPWVEVDQYGTIQKKEHGKLLSALTGSAQPNASPAKQDSNPFVEKKLSPAELKFKEIGIAMKNAKTPAELKKIAVDNKGHIDAFPEEPQARLNSHYADCLAKLTEQKEAA